MFVIVQAYSWCTMTALPRNFLHKSLLWYRQSRHEIPNKEVKILLSFVYLFFTPDNWPKAYGWKDWKGNGEAPDSKTYTKDTSCTFWKPQVAMAPQQHPTALICVLIYVAYLKMTFTSAFSLHPAQCQANESSLLRVCSLWTGLTVYTIFLKVLRMSATTPESINT